MEKYVIKKVYRIFDNLYIDKEKALYVEDDWFHKEKVIEGFTVITDQELEEIKSMGSIPCVKFYPSYTAAKKEMRNLLNN